MALRVTILSPQAPLFDGQAQSVTVPGEQGVFEIWPFHRPLISRLLPGTITVDHESVPIQRGVIKVERNTVVAIVDPA